MVLKIFGVFFLPLYFNTSIYNLIHNFHYHHEMWYDHNKEGHNSIGSTLKSIVVAMSMYQLLWIHVDLKTRFLEIVTTTIQQK
jgi:hypothetical protein